MNDSGDKTSKDQALAERVGTVMYEADAASRMMGLELANIGPGTAAMTMMVTDTMTNGHGIAHGGFIFLLADSTFAFACNSYDKVTVASSGNISFLRPAHAGDTLVASARETYRAGRNGIYDIEVKNQDDIVIAQFRGHSRTLDGTVTGIA